MYNNHSQRVALIADALAGRMYQYPVARVALLTFFDVLHLLIQKPVCFSVYDSSGERIFTSLRDPELEPDYAEWSNRWWRLGRHRHPHLLARVPGTRFSIAVHEFDVRRDAERLLPKFKAQSAKSLTDLFRILRNDVTKRGRHVIDTLARELSDPQAVSSAQAIPVRADIPDDVVQKRMESLRAALDEAFAEIAESQLLKDVLGGSGDGTERPDFVNMFCVVRTAISGPLRRGSFDYTARLWLGERQKREVKAWMASRPHAKPQHIRAVDDLEIPLGKRARSIADSVFTSGIVDFSGETAGGGRDVFGGNRRGSPDQRRQHAEAVVYGTFLDEPRPFYVPVHINGVPWLALLTFPIAHGRAAEPRRWSHNYQVYRSLIPGVATRLRAACRKLYLDLVARAFTRFLRAPSADDEIRRINDEWRELTAIYPFPRLALSASASLSPTAQEREIRTFRGMQYWLSIHANDYFEQQVEYSMLSMDEAHARCRAEIQSEYFAIGSHMNAVENELEAVLTHQLKSVIRNAVEFPLQEIQEGAPVHIQDRMRPIMTELSRLHRRLETYNGAFSDQQRPIRNLELQSIEDRPPISPEELPLRIRIEWTAAVGKPVTLAVSQRSFRALLLLLIDNAVSEMERSDFDLAAQRIVLVAERSVKRHNYVEVGVWNSNTFMRDVIRTDVGLRPGDWYTSPGHSGIGLYLFNKILRGMGADLVDPGRYFSVRNTSDPNGVEIRFSLPTVEGDG